MTVVRKLMLLVASLAACAVNLAAAPAPEILAGEIGGARYTIARPADWNGNVLLYAHGLRSEDAPLSATLDPADPVNARMLQQGWLVATSSFRRNGMIVRDAIADLEALREHINRTIGRPGLTLLDGSSMGGAIVTLMVEQMPDRYHGAIAAGAALDVRDAQNPLVPSHRPKAPLLFLSNQSELAGPTAYLEQAAHAPVPPALWTIARDGHVNINQAEHLAALDGLIAWITTDRIERRRDATVQIAAPAADVRILNGAAHGSVARITDSYGNLFTTFRAEDFAQLGIRRGEKFELQAGVKIFRVTYGANYDDAPRGEWVAFLRAEGTILLAINSGNAAITAGVKPGDPLVVRRRAEP